MKKQFLIILFFLSVQLGMAATIDGEKKTKKEELTTEQIEVLERIESRIAEIKAMDFSELSREEKKAIRVELREMKAEAKANGGGGGIYISTGAIIIILLLIIIL